MPESPTNSRLPLATRAHAVLPAALIAVCFVAARVFAHMAGLRLDATKWPTFWHFIEPSLLQQHYWQSLWYLHSQPPLFNAWLGAYQWLFGAALGPAFSVSFVILSAIMAWQVYALGKRAGLAPLLAAVLSSIMVASPAALVFEKCLFYPHPEATLLLLSVNLSLAAIERPTVLRFAAAASACCALALMRALFHPIWIALMLGVMFRFRRAEWRQLLRGAVVPVSLVLLLCAKNLALFGTTSLSSWRGMNMARVAVDMLPKPLRDEWIAQGVLSPLSAVGSFKSLAKYGKAWRVPKPSGIPVLDRPLKLNGTINLNHLAYVKISRRLERDARRAMRERPDLYAASVLENLRTTFQPSWRYRGVVEAAACLQPYLDLWNAVFGLPWKSGQTEQSGWLWFLPLLLVWAGVWLSRHRGARDPRTAVVALCVLNITYVIGVGALLERSENQRFRYDIDPLIGVLLLLAASELVRVLRTRFARSRTNSVG